jgi:hypothetical protein
MVDNNDKAVTVTEENFGELLIEGLHEALAVSRGEREPAQTRSRPIPPDSGPC